MTSKRKREDSSLQIYPPVQLSENIDPRVESLFEKKFQYKAPKSDTWSLKVTSLDVSGDPKSGAAPALTDCNSELPWLPWLNLKPQFDQLKEMKAELNCLKDRLSDKDIVKWHEHTCFTNIAGAIISAVRHSFRPELCTQAWCKFYEILSSFPVVSVQQDCLVSVHLCEAPGAFITSLNHYLVSQGDTRDWLWRASTLNPYHEGNGIGQMIDDDRFIRHSLEFWDFGVDNTGNLFSRMNRDELKRNVGQMGKANLVTADGSIDCQNNPAEQERVVSPLHYCEVVMALDVLRVGGTFVIKLFTMFEASTVTLMYILNCVFQEVHVFKPATSKSGNSEVYVICLLYKSRDNLSSPVLELMKNLMDEGCEDLEGMPWPKLPASFLDQHVLCCRQFMELQKDTILKNIDLFSHMTVEMRVEIETLRKQCTETFITKYNLQQIPFYTRVGKYPKKKRFIIPKEQVITGRQAGTFKDRNKQSGLPWQQRLGSFSLYSLTEMGVEGSLTRAIEHGDKCLGEISPEFMVCGKPLSPPLSSSRFCDNNVLGDFQDVVKHAKVPEHRKKTHDRVTAHRVALLDNLLTSLYPAFPVQGLSVYCPPEQTSTSLTAIVNKHGKDVVKVSQGPWVGLEGKESGGVFYVDVTCDGEYGAPGMEELAVQMSLTRKILHIISNLPLCSTVIIHLYTALTRFSAGLLSILYHSFVQVAMCPASESLLLDQFLVCQGFEGTSPTVVNYLKDVLHRLSQCAQGGDTALLEIVPISYILNDDAFVNLLKLSNDWVLKSFVNAVVVEEKELYGLE